MLEVAGGAEPQHLLETCPLAPIYSADDAMHWARGDAISVPACLCYRGSATMTTVSATASSSGT